MIYETKTTVAIYVDRSRQQWVVRDRDGNFWLVPSTVNPWEDRQPFHPTDETELEPVPKHYRSMLELPL
jgi:hypothetical protein